jgi:hypothetical protein
MPPRNKPNPDPAIIGRSLAFIVNLSPQTRIVYDYLKSGRSLTQVIALTNLGVGSVTSRVSELRKALVKEGDAERIVDEWKQDYSGQKYKSYKLAAKPAEGWPKETSK